MPNLKIVPKFKSESEEAKFWLTHDSTKYVSYKSLSNWSFPNLKLSTKPITIRLPEIMIDRLKIRASKMDLPYQALIKQSIAHYLSK